MAPRHVVGLGDPDAVVGPRRVQPVQLPHGLGLAARQRADRRRLPALRAFDAEAAQVARGMFDAAERFQANRLPELFAGLPRDETAASRSSTWAPTCRRRGRPAAIIRLVAIAGGDPRPVGRRGLDGSTSIRRCPTGCPSSRSPTSAPGTARSRSRWSTARSRSFEHHRLRGSPRGAAWVLGRLSTSAGLNARPRSSPPSCCYIVFSLRLPAGKRGDEYGVLDDGSALSTTRGETWRREGGARGAPASPGIATAPGA